MLGTGIAKKIRLGWLAKIIIIFVNNYHKKIELKKNTQLTRVRKKTKIFVIGFNKTGTTSAEKALSEFDLIMGHQATAVKLLDDVIDKKFTSLIDFCKTAEAFQDIPFSLPGIYKILDENFPDSKFILTVRDSEEQWFNSITKFHAKKWGKDGGIPSKEDLVNAVHHINKGLPLKYINYTFGESYYEKENYTSIYNKHNQGVVEYFKFRPNDLLVINVSKKDDYIRFCNFINQASLHDSFSWENKTSE